MPQPLSQELAQRVIDQVAPTLDFNINVMDPHGIIIASTDPLRIGGVHGAARSAASGQPGIVHDGGTPAERPGVNLPLRLDGEVIGVLGVTGPPQRVAAVAQVLVLTTTLLLERERELDASARRAAADRELLAGLVSGTLPVDAIDGVLARGLPELPAPWLLHAVLGPAGSGSPPPAVDPLPPGPHRRAAFGGALWILSGAHSPWVPGADAGHRVLDGGPCASPAGLAGAARALGALVAARGLLPPGNDDGAVLHLDELGPELSVACLPAVTAAALAERVRGLRPDLSLTVDAFVRAGSSVSGAARDLFLHRNTVVQRLDRVAQLTGLDARVPAQAHTLRLAIVAARRPD